MPNPSILSYPRKRSKLNHLKLPSFSKFYLFVSCITLVIIFILASIFSSSSNQNLKSDPSGEPIYIPDLADQKLFNSERTLFFLPGKENRCHYQYDYICKFWFYIRCFVYGAFPNIKVLSLGPDSIAEFKNYAQPGDVAVIIWRSKNHSLIPENLLPLLQWRQETDLQSLSLKPRVKIGVFHIANEVNRTNWPWYNLPDFIIRNYWISNIPLHATYIPLGHQMPNTCRPWSTQPQSWFSSGNEDICDCAKLHFKKASDRKYVWNFSGSLRKKRAILLKYLRQSSHLKDKGYIQVSKKFGGDGVYGSQTKNPKIEYLESIQQSQFVFAPCGNAMETHRIYEALSLGSIPVIENCDPSVSYFFPFRELLIDGGPLEMIKFVEKYLHRPEELDRFQLKVMNWWNSYTESIGANVSKTVNRHVAAPLKTIP